MWRFLKSLFSRKKNVFQTVGEYPIKRWAGKGPAFQNISRNPLIIQDRVSAFGTVDVKTKRGYSEERYDTHGFDGLIESDSEYASPNTFDTISDAVDSMNSSTSDSDSFDFGGGSSDGAGATGDW